MFELSDSRLGYSFKIGNEKKPILIAGPCVIESEDLVMKVADKICKLSTKYDFDFIFKSSYDKANRTSINSFRGPGIDEGLKILQKVKNQFNVPVISDIHDID